MAKIIRLPSGARIDMEQGEIRTPLGPSPIPISHNTHSYSTSRRTIWSRFNDFISNIGNWFADVSIFITNILAVILAICIAIIFVAWLISLGWLWGIIAGLLLAGVAYNVAGIVLGIFVWICGIVLAVIRYIFYNGTTFLITLALAGAVFGTGAISSLNSYITNSTKSEYTVPQTTKYYCTARSTLNVRAAPSQNARVIGVLKPNEVVDVYEITDGFARINYNGSDGYASIKYLSKQEQTAESEKPE